MRDDASIVCMDGVEIADRITDDSLSFISDNEDCVSVSKMSRDESDDDEEPRIQFDSTYEAIACKNGDDKFYKR